MIRARKPLEQRFWAMVDKRGPDDCWEWTGATQGTVGTGGGYGSINDGYGTMIRAHRLSWQWANGREIPAGMIICHRCDNPPCVNPAHLWLGTIGDNNQDTAAKGRARGQDQTHCVNGHEFTPANTYSRRPGRKCRACNRGAVARSAARRKAKAA